MLRLFFCHQVSTIAYIRCVQSHSVSVTVFAGLLTLQREKDTAYGLTLVWSLIAVYAAHKHVQSVMVVAIICIVLLVISTVTALVQKQQQRKYSAMNGGLENPLQG